LARTFIEEAAHRVMRSRAPELSDAALAALTAWSWPGNVRELRNVIERAVLLAGPVITREHLPFDRTATRTTSWPPAPLPESSPPRAETDADEQLERQRVLEALARCGGNQTHAAKLLGLARGTLAARLDAYGIARPRKKPRSTG